MKLRPYLPGDISHVDAAISALRIARYHLKSVGARRSVAKVRSALKSAEGARRHVSRIRFEEQAPIRNAKNLKELYAAKTRSRR